MREGERERDKMSERSVERKTHSESSKANISYNICTTIITFQPKENACEVYMEITAMRTHRYTLLDIACLF